MGLAWGASPNLGLIEIITSMVVSFAIINLSSAIGAQANTISDYELDSKDVRKKELVEALHRFGQQRLKRVLIVEFAVTLVLIILFVLVKAEPVLLLLWIVGISLGYLYSSPPLRIKSRSWLAPVTLMLVLAVFPILFAYLTFTSEVNSLFLLALAGLASTVYGVIIPTETRDYFGDKAMGIETLTVHLGLVKTSLLSIIFLSLGGTLIATAFFAIFVYGQYVILSLSVLAIAVTDIFVLLKLRKLYTLSKDYQNSNDPNLIAQQIITFSANNPKWIMMVTQTYSLISIILLVSKFI
jgi:4-hydroxybenzoate polyprenyltransferase